MNLFAQKIDSLSPVQLNTIAVSPNYGTSEIERLSSVSEMIIYAGKKNEVIRMDKLNADLSINNARQVFGKVPGMSVWENDGSGIQVGIAARGLSPNRSWEFNVRQNGYDISAEPFGYPEAYYSPPMEALEKIEVTRGSASLQFGPQFGGVVNYKIKKPSVNKKLQLESNQTMGSYGLFSTFNAIGGTVGKWSYYGFIQHRTAKGWRENSFYTTTAAYWYSSYQFNARLKISGEYTHNTFISQQPGGLTDKQFNIDHQQSMRERNWIGAPWNLASLNLNWKINESLEVNVKTFATFAERNSVGFTKSIIIADTLNPAINTFNLRQVDRDVYKNYGAELRTIKKYQLSNKTQFLSAGIRIYKGNTERKQLGTGTAGKDFDLSLTTLPYGRSLEFMTTNFAVFAENVFQLSKKLKIIPGIRYETIQNNGSGYINSNGTGIINLDKRTRNFFLYGIGGEYAMNEKTSFYANYSLAYRPVTFSELTPSATTDIIDPHLKDASGYNADFGYRGTIKNFLSFDVGGFYLNYENRIGSLNQNGNVFRTNIGTSVSRGIESFIELNVMNYFTDSSRFGDVILFACNAWTDARYVKWNNPEIASNPEKKIEGKRVENAPEYIHRLGLTYNLKKISATFQYSKIAAVFTDAANTVLPNATATIGKLPGYEVMDLNFTLRIGAAYQIKGGINNLLDAKYATRRSGGYPGPGILPGNGRTFYLSAGIKI